MRGWGLVVVFTVASAIAWTALTIAGHVELTTASATGIFAAAVCVGAGVGMVLQRLIEDER